MRKKLTVAIDEEVYDGLRKTIGPRKISKFIEDLARPHVVRPNLESAYAEMARDKGREKEALEWAEVTFKDTDHSLRKTCTRLKKPSKYTRVFTKTRTIF